MSEPRRHHLVPQMHLKRFADHKRRIVMVSRDQKKSFPIDIKKACVQTDYYAVETDNGRSQEVENLLSRIESDAATAIERMLSGKFPPSPMDRAAVAMFIGFQCLRGDESREGYEQVIEAMAKMMLANATRKDIIKVFREHEGRDPTEEEIAEEKLALSDLDGIVIKPHQNERIRTMLEIAPELSGYMAERAWILVDHGEPCLLTSDSPVVRWSDPTGPSGRWGRGWDTADEIQMPLSPRHSLILAKNEELDDRRFDLGSKKGPELGAEMNKLVAYSARRWIFHHPDMDPLRGITLPPIRPVLTIEGATGRMIPDD